MLEVETSSEARDRCFSMHYSKTEGKFIGRHEDCSMMHFALCFSLPFNASICDTSTSKRTKGEDSQEGQQQDKNAPSDSNEPLRFKRQAPNGGKQSINQTQQGINITSSNENKKDSNNSLSNDTKSTNKTSPNNPSEMHSGNGTMKDSENDMGQDKNNAITNADQASLLTNLLEYDLRMELYQKLQAESQASRDLFDSLNWTRSYEPFFELLWSLKLPCFDTSRFSEYPNHRSLIRLCIWKGKQLPCSSIFTTFPTDAGMCCTFNLQRADEMLKSSKFVDAVHTLQARDEAESYETTDAPEWFSDNNDKPTTGQGIRNGLTVMLDAHTDLLQDASVSEDFQGFFATITPHVTYPLVGSSSILLRPGHVNYVAITATDVQGTDKFKDTLSLEDRECFYPDEQKLDTYTQYSHSGCMLECQMKLAKKEITREYPDKVCYPWFLPHAEENMSICDPWTTRSFLQAMRDKPDDCNTCLVDCEYTEYTATVTAAPFRLCDNKNLGISRLCNVEDTFGPNPGIYGAKVWEEYDNPSELPGYARHYVTSERQYTENAKAELFSKSYDDDSEINYDAYDKDIAMVSFYFPSPKAVRYTRQPTMTSVEFLSQIGGLLGLCIGFSFCSLVEIFYWLGIRIWWSPKYRKEKRNTA